ncbi:MAG: HAD-IA family hydrolase [Gammaproteobacteria bacterium]|nr:HAD-IA family hydrolase [Gammaproteobacteria bacterium]
MTNGSIDSFDAILFDLDGTLVDTAPDMVAVLLGMQEDHGLDLVSYDLARSHVSHGAIALVRLAFPDADDDLVKKLHKDYLDRYEEAVCVDSVLYPDIANLLDSLDAADHPWGIVTNKPTRMTEPLLLTLGLRTRTGCLVCGDTLPQRKPDPEPLLHASRQIGVPSNRAIYVGDSLRDIEAGRAAGMGTIAASYGYITDDDDPAAWQADLVVSDPRELTHYLLKGVTLSR